MSRKFFSGTSLEQAVLAAARHYELEPGRVAYSLRDKKHGFLTVRRKFVIEIDPQAPERPDGEEAAWEPKLAGRPSRSPAPTPTSTPTPTPTARPAAAAELPVGSDSKPASTSANADAAEQDQPRAQRSERGAAVEAEPEQRERKERPAPVTDDALEAADMALGNVADFLFYDMQWDIRLDDDDVVRIELGGEDSHKIIEEDGRLLRSIEHLLPRLIRSKLGQGVSCTVDCEGFKEAHEEHLRSLAERVAEEVASSQRSKLLEPMTPADRRLIHVSLVDDPNVETESEGRGFKKRVRVVPAESEEAIPY